MDHLPGSDNTPIIPGGGYDATKAQTLLDEIYNIASNTEDKLSEGIIGNLADVETVCNNLKTTLLGTMGIAADDIDRVCAKVAEKVQRGLEVKMTEVYKYLYQAGFPVPTIEQVKYGNATGDVIGSMLDVPTAMGGMGNDVIPQPVPLPPPPTPLSEPPPMPSGGFNPGNPVWPFPWFVQPPSNAPPAFGDNGQQFVCPTGWIASSPMPGYTPSCYPGPLLPILYPTNPGAPYGYDPMGSGMPLCQNGSLPGVGMSCDPPVPMPISWVPGQPMPTQQTPPTSGSCPAGTQPVPGWTAEGVQGTTVPGWLKQASKITPCPPGFPQIKGGWTTTFDVNTAQTLSNGAVLYAPFTTPLPTTGSAGPGGWCIPAGCIFGGAQADVILYTWGDTDLYVNKEGMVVSGPPGLDWTGLTPLPIINCNIPAPMDPSNPPTGQCVPIPEQCALPKKFDCAAPPKSVKMPVRQGEDECKRIADMLEAIKQEAPKISDVITFLGSGVDPGNSIEATVAKWIFGSGDPVMPSLIKRFAEWMQQLVTDAVKSENCDSSALLPIALYRAIYEFADKWTGVIPEQVKNEIRILANTACQSELPSANEADRAWLNDSITDGDWECYTKADGKIVGPAKTIRDGERTKANVHEVFQLMLRNYISGDDAKKRLRALGVIKQEDETDFYNLTTQWPAFQDLIRFMVRDVFNEQTVTDAQMDQGFEQNYTEQAKKYGTAAGVPDELAKYFWRAHWQIPSYTMLREMLFRLRPDEYPPDMAVTQDVMRKALEQDDWAPGFVKRMIETSYNTITRSDGIMMYLMHTIDDDTLVKQLMNNGYKEKDARTIQEHYKVKRRINDYLKAGYPTLKQAVTLYARCQIDPETLNDIIGKLATGDEQKDAALEAAEIARDVWERKQAVTTIQREYKLGLLSDTDATQALAERGVDPGCIPGLVRAMRRNNQRSSKYLTAAQLCKMRKYGILTDQVQLNALIRQGWDSADALRIVASCDRELMDAQAKELAKQATAAAKQAAADAKAAKKNGKPTRTQ